MNKERYVWLQGQRIPVSEDVYRAYYRPVWREAKQKERCDDKEYSLDALMEDGFEAVSREALVDDIIADKLLLDELLAALSELSGDERALIDRFFYQQQPERDIAKETGVSRNTLVYRKNKILEKLKNLIEKI